MIGPEENAEKMYKDHSVHTKRQYQRHHLLKCDCSQFLKAIFEFEN